MSEQIAATTMRKDLLSESQLREQSRRFFAALRPATQSGNTDINGALRSTVRDSLGELSRERAIQGFTPRETATFVFR